MSTTSVPPAVIWLPRVSSKPNRARILMPFRHGARFWLRAACGPGTSPQFERRVVDFGPHRFGGVWTVSRRHFPAVSSTLATEYGAVLCVQDYTLTQLCTAGCQRAKEVTQHMCECVCGGRNHGRPDAASWTEGELFAYHDHQQRRWVMTS